MRSSTTSSIALTLTPFVALAVILAGCGREPEPANVPATENRTATPTADPLDGPGLAPRESRAGATSPGSIFDSPGSQTDIQRAREVLLEVGRTYRNAPTLSDELALSAEGQPPQSMRLRFDRNNERVEMALPTQAATYIDGKVYFTSTLVYDLYLEIEAADDPAIAIAENFNWVPPYHFAMRAGEGLSDEAAVDSYLTGLGLGILRNPRLRGYTRNTDDDGREFHRITVESSTGVGQVLVDEQTMLVERMSLQILPPPGQPAHMPPTQMLIVANPVLADELDEPIVFDPGDRQRVTEPQAMDLRQLGPGDLAPNYRFTTPDGEVVRLHDLRGNVVIVDFWATWCVPCMQGLPHLNRFAQWVVEENQPVKVLAVNTREQHETFEERREAVERLWNEREFSTPLVYDVESTAVMRTGYGNIPLLLVIDPEGRITRVKDRFDRNMYQILKAEAERAMRGVQASRGGE